MTKLAEMTSPRTLELPSEVAELFRPADRFVVWAEGDTLYLKRITPTPVTKIVAQAPKGKPMTMDEVNEIVHEVRRRKQLG